MAHMCDLYWYVLICVNVFEGNLSWKWVKKQGKIIYISKGVLTPRKINMEPENRPTPVKGKSSSKPLCSGSMLIFRGVVISHDP